MKVSRANPNVQCWELNFTKSKLDRGRRKDAGVEDPQLMDSDDERDVLDSVERRSSRLNLPIPGLELFGAQTYGRATQLFGAGHAAISSGTTPEQVRADLHTLAVAVAPPEERRKLFRGGVILKDEIDGIRRSFNQGARHPDNYAAAYALLHGYMKGDSTRTTDRPPSTTTVPAIADRYARSRTRNTSNPAGAKELHITIVMKGSSHRNHSAKGMTSRFQVAGGGGKREILLDDRNTYRIDAFKEDRVSVDVTIVAEGESGMGNLARTRSNFPTDPASLTQEAAFNARMRPRRASDVGHTSAWQQTHPYNQPVYPHQAQFSAWQQIHPYNQPVYPNQAQFTAPPVIMQYGRSRHRSNSFDAYYVTPGVGTQRVPVIPVAPVERQRKLGRKRAESNLFGRFFQKFKI